MALKPKQESKKEPEKKSKKKAPTRLTDTNRYEVPVKAQRAGADATQFPINGQRWAPIAEKTETNVQDVATTGHAHFVPGLSLGTPQQNLGILHEDGQETYTAPPMSSRNRDRATRNSRRSTSRHFPSQQTIAATSAKVRNIGGESLRQTLPHATGTTASMTSPPLQTQPAYLDAGSSRRDPTVTHILRRFIPRRQPIPPPRVPFPTTGNSPASFNYPRMGSHLHSVSPRAYTQNATMEGQMTAYPPFAPAVNAAQFYGQAALVAHSQTVEYPSSMSAQYGDPRGHPGTDTQYQMAGYSGHNQAQPYAPTCNYHSSSASAGVPVQGGIQTRTSTPYTMPQVAAGHNGVQYAQYDIHPHTPSSPTSYMSNVAGYAQYPYDQHNTYSFPGNGYTNADNAEGTTSQPPYQGEESEQGHLDPSSWRF
ncbi:hypothetical protein OBBRIDRAFT_839996 [Obba rivulosa]|uniref:Uncharacterized protein n=1 Tax=Obba rivulosa TaxID=1052685 RepID=A0A8E2ARU5_9APHY|nr:hypothetical protein OBBRIDRAFT_839996 [Obba rivulosa]